MSHFYGTVDGQSKTQATVFHREEDDTDMASARLTVWHGGGMEFPLYSGPARGPHTSKELAEHVRFNVKQALRRGAFPLDLERAMTEAIAEITKG